MDRAGLDFRILTEPQQGASYQDLLAMALTAEQSGFSGFFRSDHYLKMGDVNGQPGPSHAWVSLAGLARDTNSIRLGTLVSPITFYRPGPLAIMVAQVDAMSGGRVDFGIGAGWYEAEHSSHGLDFPPLGERFDRLEEAVEQITGLWSTGEGDTFDHHGKFHTFVDAPGLPKPIQRPGPPIIIGGRGPRRTPRLAARFGAELNVPFADVAEVKAMNACVDEACATIDRNPAELVRSATLTLCLGASETEVGRRAEAIGQTPDQLRKAGAAGTVEEVVDKLGRYAEAGVGRIYLQVLDLTDPDHVALAGHDLIHALGPLS